MLMFAFAFCACAHAMNTNTFDFIKQRCVESFSLFFSIASRHFRRAFLFHSLSFQLENGNIQWMKKKKEKKSHTKVKRRTQTNTQSQKK